jgi:hypothetical protein
LVSGAVDRVLAELGGWPKYFRAQERAHGAAILGQMVRDRMIDEAVFGIVVRYAVHRAKYDELSARILKETRREAAEDMTESGHFLSAAEQARAYHFNKLAVLEQQLLATPYQRAKQGMRQQTSFMDQLTQPATAAGAPAEVVTPFRPLTRPGRDGAQNG